MPKEVLFRISNSTPPRYAIYIRVKFNISILLHRFAWGNKMGKKKTRRPEKRTIRCRACKKSLKKIRHTIAVMKVKGSVGKTTVAANLPLFAKWKEAEWMTESKVPGFGRGGGSGYGGGFGYGLGGECYCPNCGYKELHRITAPCYNQTCPRCGTPMTR